MGDTKKCKNHFVLGNHLFICVTNGLDFIDKNRNLYFFVLFLPS